MTFYFVVDEDNLITIYTKDDQIFRKVAWTDEGVVTIHEKDKLIYMNDFNIKINDMAINPDDIESLYIATDNGVIYGNYEKGEYQMIKQYTLEEKRVIEYLEEHDIIDDYKMEEMCGSARKAIDTFNSLKQRDIIEDSYVPPEGTSYVMSYRLMERKKK